MEKRINWDGMYDDLGELVEIIKEEFSEDIKSIAFFPLNFLLMISILI